jgi:hypothetical protein
MNFETPQLDPLITKEFLLSKNSEETYMSTYLRLPIRKGLQVVLYEKTKDQPVVFVEVEMES